MTNVSDEWLLAGMPDWVLALLLVSVAIAAALTAHALFQRLVIVFWAGRHPVLGTLASRTRGVTRYAPVLFALSLVMPLLPLDPVTTATANRVFIAAVVLLIGWIVLVAANAGADYYVGRLQACLTTYFPAIVVTALLGGFRPGVVATLLVSMIAWYPTLPDHLDPQAGLWFALLILVTTVNIAVVALLNAAVERSIDHKTE